jgi:hypothetical protein
LGLLAKGVSMSRFQARWVVVLLAVALGPSGARGGPAEPPGPAAPRLTPDDKPALVADLPAPVDPQVAALQEQVRALQEQLKTVEELSLQSHNRLQAIERDLPQADATAAVNERLMKLEAATSKLPESADVVSAGDFPGSLRIPGTDAALKLGGQVRVVLVDSLAAIGSGDRFVTSSIPIRGTAVASEEARVVMTAIPSRFNFDVRSPSQVGDLRAFIEADFAGSGGALRLRHAFARWGNLLVGQTWSTFADPEAEPDSIDFEGLNAISLFRQVQVRYTQPLAEKLKLAVSLENPKPEVTDATGVNQFPDLVLRLRWDAARPLGLLGLLRSVGHVQAAVVLRQLRVAAGSPTAAVVSTRGYGLGVSGRLNTGWVFEGDDLTFSAYAGEGIARYITDLDTFGGQDAVYDTAAGTLEALPVVAGYVGYELRWNKRLRSTLTLGWVRVSNLDVQDPSSLKQTLRGSGNLIWSPESRLDFVVEFMAGKRWNRDGSWGQASQIQIGTRYLF